MRSIPIGPLVLISFVLASVTCLADDRPKAVGDNFFINTEWVAGSVGGKSSVASNGTDFLVAWRDRRAYATNGYDIYCARVTRNGVVLDPHGIGISVGPTDDSSPSNQYIPSVNFDGTNYVVFWVDNKLIGSLQYQIYAARVSPEGTVLDPGGVQITSLGADPQRMPGVAFDGTNFMITWRTTGNVVRAMRVSKALQSLDGTAGFSITSPAYYPSIAFDGTNYVIAYHFGGAQPWGTGAAIVGKDGTIVKQHFVVSQEAMSHEHASVASSGSNSLIVWYDWKPNNNGITGSIYAARIDLSGNVLDAQPIKVSDDGRGQVWPEVTFDGADYFVVWQQETSPSHRAVDIHGRRIGVDGALGERIGIATGSNTQFAPGLAYASGRFLVVWQGQCSSDGPGFCGPDGVGLEGQLIDPADAPMTSPEPTSLTAEGSSWTLSAGPFGAGQMNAVWAASDTNVYIGGRSLQRFDGNTWTVMTGPWDPNGSIDLYAFWGSSATDIWATGLSSKIFHFNGSVWSFDGTLNCCTAFAYSGYGLWGLSPNNVWIVGSRGNANQWSGTTWTPHFLPTATTAWSVWGSAANDVYAIGDHGRIFHYDGANWSTAADVPTSVTLNHIWGSSSSNIFAVGDFGTVLRFDGTSWVKQSTGTEAHLYGVFGSTGSNVYAVGQHGLILHYDGVQWRSQASGTTTDLTSLWTVGPGSTLYAAGGVVVKTTLAPAATLAVSKSALNLGTGLPGQRLQGTVTLSVSGQTPLQVTQIAATGGFQQTNDCGATVAVGGSCTVTVRLVPETYAQYNGALSIITNAVSSPSRIPLTGTGMDLVFSLTRPARTPRTATSPTSQADALVSVIGPDIPLQMTCDVPGARPRCSVEPNVIHAGQVPLKITIKVPQAVTRASRLRHNLPSTARLSVVSMAPDRPFLKVIAVPLTY